MKSQKPQKESAFESFIGAMGFTCLFFGLLMMEQWLVDPARAVMGV